MVIQKRENDLALATFGRGFYILDDYTPLRGLTRQTLEKEAVLFPVKPALAYIESSPLGGRGKADQSDSFFVAPNPPFGATFTYYLKDEIRTLQEQRHEAEKEAAKENKETPYPTHDQLREEAREEKPAIIVTVTDADGNVVRRLTGPVEKGFHRVAWDLRYPPSNPTRTEPPREEPAPWDLRERGRWRCREATASPWPDGSAAS
jgi:hypothetical protein